MLKKYFFTSLFLLVAASTALFAKVGDWITFTNQGDIRDIIVQGDTLWCATNGGVFRYDFVIDQYEQFNNTNGLSSNDAQAIEVDQHGNIWVAFSDGWINCLKVGSDSWDFIFDYRGHAIYDLKTIGDSLLVALDIGVSLYDIQRKEVKETYKNLGWALPVEIDVTNITVDGRDIWAATDFGIAKTNFDLANLMAPESWTNYTSSSGLPSNQVNVIISHHDSIFAGTANGIAVLAEGAWTNVSEGLSATNITDMLSQNDKLYALSKNKLCLWNRAEQKWQQIGTGLVNLSCLAISSVEGTIWIGRNRSWAASGFAKLTEENQWETFTPPGPPSNEINCLAVDKNQILWCGSNDNGILKYDGQTWSQITKQEGLLTNRIDAVTVDNQNRKWFATPGGGAILIDDNENISIFHNQYLSGATGATDYVVVTDIEVDRYNNVWMLNLAAANNKVVAVYSAQLEWQYFTIQEGIFSSAVRAIDFDNYDRAWIGSDGGLNVIDYGHTLMYKADDDYSGTLTTADGLISNQIKDVAIDHDNIVWIATDGGLNYWAQGAVYEQYGLVSNSINAIEIDIRNNKWFGTSAGVSMLAHDGYTWTHYSTDDSPLVSDNVTSFGFEEKTGKVYIGTTNGISCLLTPFSSPREDLSQVTAGPNPFISNNGQNFAISNLADDVSIKFMTENGMVVREISKDDILGSQAYWDGKNNNGAFIASGIYLYVIYNEESGMNRVGKVAVIR